MDTKPTSPYMMFKGDHLFAELYGVEFSLLDDEEFLSETLKRAVPKGNASLRQVVFEKFEPHGVSVVALLSESHVSFHTYPESGCLFLDVFTCGDCQPHKIYQEIVALLSPRKTHCQEIVRGQISEPMAIPCVAAKKSS